MFHATTTPHPLQLCRGCPIPFRFPFIRPRQPTEHTRTPAHASRTRTRQRTQGRSLLPAHPNPHPIAPHAPSRTCIRPPHPALSALAHADPTRASTPAHIDVTPTPITPNVPQRAAHCQHTPVRIPSHPTPRRAHASVHRTPAPSALAHADPTRASTPAHVDTTPTRTTTTPAYAGPSPCQPAASRSRTLAYACSRRLAPHALTLKSTDTAPRACANR
ncbi:hypothetical protein PLICRDRAFT_175106 [Plicaturopsis crispa FD-325 SS-3]|nr:hypothetical protein PLICRDRAFT_175106 [Plicaturopsis crispa FD-325 SS-3]